MTFRHYFQDFYFVRLRIWHPKLFCASYVVVLHHQVQIRTCIQMSRRAVEEEVSCLRYHCHLLPHSPRASSRTGSHLGKSLRSASLYRGLNYVLFMLPVLQPFEVFRAIERKDLMFLMEVRDRAFSVGLAPDSSRI